MELVRKFAEKGGLEVTLRPAQPGDSCALIDTVRSNAMERSYVLMEHYGRDVETEREYILGLDRDHNLLLVATAGEEVLGCLAALQADAGKRPETAHNLLVGLHQREAFRGRGIGSAMLSYLEEWATAAGFKKLEASIFTTNQRSLHLFTKAGFTEEGVRQNRIRIGKDFIDEVLLGKIL